MIPYFLRAWVAAVAALLLGGCTGWDEAFRDRVSDREPSVELGCESATLPKTALAPPLGPLLVRRAPERPSPIVAELFEVSGAPGPAVVASGIPPNARLGADVGALLEDSGVALTEDPDAARAFLSVEVTRLHARQDPAGLFELRGTTIGRVDARVELARPSADPREWTASATEQVESIYFHASDIELVFERAWCRVLADLDTVMRSSEFRSALAEPAR